MTANCYPSVRFGRKVQSVGVCNVNTELTSCTPSSVSSVAMDKSQGEFSLLGGNSSANSDYGVPLS